MASLAESRARRGPLPGSGLARSMIATFGPIPLASLAKSNPDSCLSKTCRESLFSMDSAAWPAIFTTWVLRLRRASLARRKSAQATSGSGCSSWPTAQAVDVKEKPQPLRKKTDRQTRNETPGSYRGDLADHAVMWQMPQQPAGGGTSRSGERIGEPLLDGQARLWKIPHGMGNLDAEGKAGGAGGGEFAKQANRFSLPAPQTSMLGGKSSKSTRRLNPLWITPRTANIKGSKQRLAQGSNESVETQAQAMTGKRRLNPRFVEWLMNWPMDWTQWQTAQSDCECSETVSCLYRRRMRSALLRLVSSLTDSSGVMPQGE